MANDLNISDSIAPFTIPTIVTWNRIEGRPRSESFDRSLKAEIRDALWMLTRQWQSGEFQGDDAATPVFAKIMMETTRLTKFQDRTDVIETLDYSRPLEARVERLSITSTLAFRLQVGRYWLKMLRTLPLSGDVNSYIDSYKSTYPILLPPAEEASAQIYAHPRVLELYAGAQGRGMDGGAFYLHLAGGAQATDGITFVEGDEDLVNDAGAAFQAWYGRQYDHPTPTEKSCWAPERLEYAFAVSAPTNTDGSEELVLVADEYCQGHLDWYSFDIDSTRDLLGPSETPASGTITAETRSFLPAPIGFAGMPNVRWWEFEDRFVDFGDIDANTTDTAKLLLMEFGLLYGNDWFIVPFVLPIGTLAHVKGLEVTDSFGQRTWIEATGSGPEDDWQRWNMYTLNQRGDVTQSDTRLLLPPAVGKVLQSQPIESVNLLRDEMANMVWAVEGSVPLETGVGRPGLRAARELRQYLERLLGAVDDSTVIVETDADIRYTLGTTVPENWIPFIPVRSPDSLRDIELQRGAMLRIMSGVDGTVPIEPRTRIIRQGIDEGKSYYIHEEEVPRSGAIITETYQRTRWTDGRVFLWMGRRKSAGRGERSSGLKFDQIARKRQS